MISCAQNGPLFSPETYRQLLKPRQRKLFEAVKHGSDVKILYPYLRSRG